MAESGHTSASTVNAEAGAHPISADPLERLAAVSATRLSWKEFPYYPRRYGERGWRFSLSDSGWIETLCGSSAGEAKGQVLWLSGLLSARGMPSYLMERHLEHLHAELVRASHERSERYEILRTCASILRERRVAQIPDPAFAAFSDDFDRRGAACRTPVANVGRVIVAAVADERAGVPGVVESVTSWTCDPAVFDESWITAVKQTVAAARAYQS